MTEFISLSTEEKKEIISQVSFRTGMTGKAIEKDWWVTLTLRALFGLAMSEHFIFKGGTSLSKCWKLIERFSEDVDIALAPEAFGMEYVRNPTRQYVKNLKRKGCVYTSTTIKEALNAAFFSMGVPANTIMVQAEPVKKEFPDKDPQTLFVTYPSIYEPKAYIADNVKVEFSVRSLKDPYSNASV